MRAVKVMHDGIEHWILASWWQRSRRALEREAHAQLEMAGTGLGKLSDPSFEVRRRWEKAARGAAKRLGRGRDLELLVAYGGQEALTCTALASEERSVRAMAAYLVAHTLADRQQRMRVMADGDAAALLAAARLWGRSRLRSRDLPGEAELIEAGLLVERIAAPSTFEAFKVLCTDWSGSVQECVAASEAL